MLLKRGATYYCRVWVPLDMRELIGRRELKKSLKTSDRKEAKTAATALLHRAETTFLRLRTGMLTDRELEILKAELVAEFTGKIEEHRRSRGTVLDFLQDGVPCTLDPNFDLNNIHDTFRYVKPLKDVKALADNYAARVENLENELATGLYSFHTRLSAHKIVQEKGLDVPLPCPNWFSENEPEWSKEPPKDFGRLCETVIRAMIDNYKVEQERVYNKRDTPLQAQIAERIEAAKPRPKLSDLWEEHRQEKEAREKWAESTKEKNSTAVRTTIKLLGNRELGSYSDADATRLIEELKRKGLGVSHINFTLELLSTLWIRAMKRPKLWYVEYNPWSEKQLSDNRNESELKDDYTLKEIEGLFRGLSSKDVRRLVHPEKYWVPLIALYSGMRLNEVCQLRTEDIEDVDGVLIFNIRHRPELNQEVKNKQDRTCPVHPTLLKLGFGRYAEEQRAKGEDRLFSNLTLWRGKWKRKIEGWYNRTFEPKHVSDADTKSFHSLRHTFCNAFKQGGLLKTRDDEYVLKSMVGHIEGLDLSGGLTLNRYGKAFTPKKQLALLKRLDYGVDLGLLEKTK